MRIIQTHQMFYKLKRKGWSTQLNLIPVLTSINWLFLEGSMSRVRDTTLCYVHQMVKSKENRLKNQLVWENQSLLIYSSQIKYQSKLRNWKMMAFRQTKLKATWTISKQERSNNSRTKTESERHSALRIRGFSRLREYHQCTKDISRMRICKK